MVPEQVVAEFTITVAEHGVVTVAGFDADMFMPRLRVLLLSSLFLTVIFKMSVSQILLSS